MKFRYLMSWKQCLTRTNIPRGTGRVDVDALIPDPFTWPNTDYKVLLGSV